MQLFGCTYSKQERFRKKLILVQPFGRWLQKFERYTYRLKQHPSQHRVIFVAHQCRAVLHATMETLESMVVCKICFGWKEHEPQPILIPESKAVYDRRSGAKTCPICSQEWSSILVVKGSKWVRIRERPRIPPEVDYKMCRNLPRCQKGQRCSHAHSQAELLFWVKERAELEPRSPPQLPPPPNNGPRHYHLCTNVGENGCSVKCKFPHSEQEKRAWEKLQIRAPPLVNISVALDGYKLCWHIASGKRCLYGEYCTFAHSHQELDEWNQQLQRAYAENQDFASLLRTKVSSNYKELQEIQGFEVSWYKWSVNKLLQLPWEPKFVVV